MSINSNVSSFNENDLVSINNIGSKGSTKQVNVNLGNSAEEGLVSNNNENEEGLVSNNNNSKTSTIYSSKNSASNSNDILTNSKGSSTGTLISSNNASIEKSISSNNASASYNRSISSPASDDVELSTIKSVNDTEELHFKIIDKFFKENTWVDHHLQSVNNFYDQDVSKVLRDMNPLTFRQDVGSDKKTYKYNIELYFGGKNGKKIYYGKPTIYDGEHMRVLYPNEARLRNVSYTTSIHVDIDVVVTTYGVKNEDIPEKEGTTVNAQHPMGVEYVSNFTIERHYLGNFPIMLHSNLCTLYKLPQATRYDLGECKHDYGGYFLIDGKEKVLVPQENFSNNIIYIRTVNDDKHDYSVEVRSISKDESKPKRTFAIRRTKASVRSRNEYLLAWVPNVRKPVPVFILFYALGLKNDKEIFNTIFGYDMDKYKDLWEYIRPSVTDAGGIYDQATAIEFISSLTKEHSTHGAYYILSEFLLPHIGEMNFAKKADYLGYMIFELIKVIAGINPLTDRDNYRFKRVDTSGQMMRDLFSEYAKIMYKAYHLEIEKEFYYNKIQSEQALEEELTGKKPEVETKRPKKKMFRRDGTGAGKKDQEREKAEEETKLASSDYRVSHESFETLIKNNYNDFFRDQIIANGFKKAFKGDWGAFEHTKKVGVIQPLNRLSYNSFLAHLRKTNLPIDSGSKLVKPHMLHGSQWGIIDPIDTPDGGNVGFHKNMALLAKVTHDIDDTPLIQWLFETMNNKIQVGEQVIELRLKDLTKCTTLEKKAYFKVFVNGLMIGMTNLPVQFQKMFLHARRSNLIPIYISIGFDIKNRYVQIYSDGGRMIRPVVYTPNGILPYEIHTNIKDKLKTGDFTWSNCIYGFRPESENGSYNVKFLNMEEHDYLVNSNGAKSTRAILDYIDKNEEEFTYICMNSIQLDNTKSSYTHCEIHPSTMFGVMGQQVIFPEHNQLPRNLFGCGQAKQAVSLYSSNYLNRIDKMGVILNYGDIPIVKNRLFKYIHEEEHPYGFNAIVAIMSYDAFNVEDSILFNAGSVGRGMYHTTYFSMYEAYEEDSKIKNSKSNIIVKNIHNEPDINVRAGYDYNYLDEYGMIKENTLMDDKKAVIGRVSYNATDPNIKSNASVYPKKGQLGYVDKTYITKEQEGRRIAKVRIRELRIPAMGDKFCSRCGQKGTIGRLINEQDMPFTKSGLRPDIIINPHAIPSRMTIGQLIETIESKLGVHVGMFVDATPYSTSKDKIPIIGKKLTEHGYHSSGMEVLYNGLTGEQIKTSIFMGPTYYMRLKHMVKDKINYRARGPRTLLTRQTNHGRANDGGLRVGEMERDGLLAHGCSYFLQESMMERGDKYKLAICDQTGSVAIFDKSTKNLYSPMLDGPMMCEVDSMNINRVTKISEFGRTFSIVDIPYSFKLLMQELGAMNIQLYLITDKNINNLKHIMSIPKNYTEDVKDYNVAYKHIKLQSFRNYKIANRNEYNTGDNMFSSPLNKLPEETKKSVMFKNTPKITEVTFDGDSEPINRNIQQGELSPDMTEMWEYVDLPGENVSGYISLTTDSKGEPSELIVSTDPILNDEAPTFYPKGWDKDKLRDNELSSLLVYHSLLKNRTIPNNFNRVVDKMINMKSSGLPVTEPVLINTNINVPPPPPPQMSINQQPPQMSVNQPSMSALTNQEYYSPQMNTPYRPPSPNTEGDMYRPPSPTFADWRAQTANNNSPGFHT